MKSHRLARVSEVIREVAASTILFNLKDPRVKNVTVTRVEVSADLQHTKIYVSVMGTEREQQLTMYGLKSAAGFVQTKIAAQLTTRYVPHVTFVLDEGVKRSIEISRLLHEAQQQSRVDAAARGETTEDSDDQPEAADGSANPAD